MKRPALSEVASPFKLRKQREEKHKLCTGDLFLGKVSVGMSATHEGGSGSVINIDIDMVLRVVKGEREQLQQQDMEAAVARWRPPAGQCKDS